jgi:hypothetical protein
MRDGFITYTSTGMGGCFATAIAAGEPDEAVWLVVFLSELPHADNISRTNPVKNRFSALRFTLSIMNKINNSKSLDARRVQTMHFTTSKLMDGFHPG